MSEGVSRRRIALAMGIVTLLAFGAAAAGIGVRASYGARVTGDEPHYLLTAMTLWEDHDLNVADEIAGDRYRDSHEVALDPQAEPLAGGRMVSPHDPLLPALLAPFVGAGGWIGAKLAMAALGGLLAALTLWVGVRRFDLELWPATLAVAVFAVSAPFAVYGSQVYPELPAALAVVACIAALTGRLRWQGCLVAVAGVAALPWLSIKYVPVAAALALLLVTRLWRSDRARTVWLASALLVVGALFLVAHQLWYGGWTPYAAGDHFVGGEFGVVGFSPNYPGRSVRLIGLLVDRRFGLAAWQPAWLLLVPAAAAWARARPRGWTMLAAPLAIGWLVATFVALTMQGWWWPGRQVVVVLPCAVLLIAHWAQGSGRRLALLGASGVAGVSAFGWIVWEGSSGRLTWVVDFFETSFPLYRAWSHVLPDYLDANWSTWVLHGAWLTVFVALGVWGWKRGARGPASRTLGRLAPYERREQKVRVSTT